ncbi:MAG TPA: GerMN domain-containing protein [Candidatus Acidoferrales bacterium]|nr:GerMN domain-containing protein [Candidatus Acidoferrales bacterium]
MTRKWKIVIGILALAVVVGLINFGDLRRRVQRLSETQSTEEQARREVLAPPITTPTDVLVQAKIFWAAGPGQIAPVAIQLPLSADPVQRSKQVLHALIANPPTPEQRTIPADAELLGFYVLPNGTAIADFSDAFASETPSGILSEEMAVDSIVQTLENNVPTLRRLKILIHGQEADTLAGHVDLTGFFDLNPPVQQPPAPAAAGAPAAPGTSLPATTSAPPLPNAPLPPGPPGGKP